LTTDRTDGGHARRNFQEDPMASKNVLEVTDANFQSEIESHQGVAVVDLWATWCGPCRLIAPIVEQLATEYEGRVKVAKMDVDANPATAMRFNVRSIPTILFFRDGKVVDTVIGAVPKTVLAQRFDQLAGKATAA
jgi:thioredoxin 1